MKVRHSAPEILYRVIHMNGRVYDPTLGRMLQADPFIQSPGNTQSYNRYTYALNNPHRYTDPSGYFFKEIIDVVVVVAAVYMEVQCGGCGAGFQVANTWFASGARVAVGVAENAFTAFAGGNYLEGTLAIGKGIVCNGPTAMDCPATEGLDQLAQLGDGLIQQGRGGGSRTAAQIAEGTYAPWTGPKYASGVVSTTWAQASSSQREAAQRKAWPVPGYRKLNSADRPGEGDGIYGSCRGGGCKRPHSGIDIEAPVGSDVVSFADGKVVSISPNPSSTYGNQVVIDHGNGVFSQSAHLDSLNVSPGDTVKAGQLIGAVGRTGNTPPAGDSHLHFEIRIGTKWPVSAGGQTDDPMEYLP
jgi:RHS repeat-associated protein